LSDAGKKMAPEAAATAPRASVHPSGENTVADKAKAVANANQPSDGAATEHLLYSHQKRGSGEQLIVRIASYRGHRYCDVRMWVASPDGLRPTKKGVCVSLQELKALGAALIAWNDDTGAPEPAEAA
jgi:hypothetical protein